MLSLVGLLAIMLMAGVKTVQNSAQSARCQSNLRSIGVAVASFLADHGKPPSITAGTLNEYMGIPYAYGKTNNPVNPVWFCPADRRPREEGWISGPFGSTKVSYGANQEVIGTDSAEGTFGKTPVVKIARPSETINYIEATRYYCGNKPADQRAAFRHSGGNALNILFFDGHVEQFAGKTDEEKALLYENKYWRP